RALRRVLLEEGLAGDPVRVALHRERAAPKRGHESRRHRPVVLDQVALRDAVLRPERLVEVREVRVPRHASGLTMDTAGRGAAWQRAAFGTPRSPVRIRPPRPWILRHGIEWSARPAHPPSTGRR